MDEEVNNTIGADAWLGKSISVPKPDPKANPKEGYEPKNSLTSVPEEVRFKNVPPPMTNPSPEAPFLPPGEATKRLRERLSGQPKVETNPILEGITKSESEGVEKDSQDYTSGVLKLIGDIREAKLDGSEVHEILYFLGGTYDLGKSTIEPIHTLSGSDLPPDAQNKIFRAMKGNRVLAVGIGNAIRNVRVIKEEPEGLPN